MRRAPSLPSDSQSRVGLHSALRLAAWRAHSHIFSNVIQFACVALGVGTSAKER